MTANVPNLRPFHKKKSHLSIDKKDLRTFLLQYPKTHDQVARTFWRHNQNNQQEKEDEEIIIILTMGFKRLLDIQPFHLAKVNE